MNKSYNQSTQNHTDPQRLIDEYLEFATKGYSEEEKKQFYEWHKEITYQNSQVFKTLNWNELTDEQKTLSQKTSKIGRLQKIAARDSIPSYLPESFKVTASEELMNIADKLSPLINIMEAKRQSNVDKLVHACEDENADEVSFFLQSGLIDLKVYYAEVYDSLYELANKSEKQALDALHMQIEAVPIIDIEMLKAFPKVMQSQILSHCYKGPNKVAEFFKIKNEKARAADSNSAAVQPKKVKKQ
jgi:hypothetical protein